MGSIIRLEAALVSLKRQSIWLLDDDNVEHPIWCSKPISVKPLSD